MGSSWTRDRTRVPCIGRQILNHCTTREVPNDTFFSHILLASLSSHGDPRGHRPCPLQLGIPSNQCNLGEKIQSYTQNMSAVALSYLLSHCLAGTRNLFLLYAEDSIYWPLILLASMSAWSCFLGATKGFILSYTTIVTQLVCSVSKPSL